MELVTKSAYQITVCAQLRDDMPGVPRSWLGYAQKCAPSPLARQLRHLNSVSNAA
ncbi:MAG: hypothetical protein O3C43_14750 [Verrucomicrobia bacterium]|nr:hypothetical protein [Verrucomicrobiota bacterium]